MGQAPRIGLQWLSLVAFKLIHGENAYNITPFYTFHPMMRTDKIPDLFSEYHISQMLRAICHTLG